MIGFVVASHGKLSKGLVDAVNIIMGEPEALETVCLTNEGGIEVFKRDLEASIKKVSSKDGVLILTDLQSGTPYNTGVMLANTGGFDFDIKVASGINLPVMLELLAQRNNSSLDDLVKIILECGSKSINVYKASKSNSDEDDPL
jgi:mannose/fructose/sorbose-specific phosphotransferase system IIA component